VPAESPTLGLTHLQFEALLTAARNSANRCDFALVRSGPDACFLRLSVADVGKEEGGGARPDPQLRQAPIISRRVAAFDCAGAERGNR
jgi:hypothetical protein